METATSRNTRLGIMVIVGFTLLITAIYLIGDKQNLFGTTIKLNAKFSTVNGLRAGNNVRYVGIDVGTVSNIQIINDSIVLVEMTVESEAMEYIRSNTRASIGTDGLMGNKLVNIHSTQGEAPYIKEGDEIETIEPLDTDKIMRTLSRTNDEMFMIAENLKSITEKFQGNNIIWDLLGDSTISMNIRNAMKNIEHTTFELTALTESFNDITKDVEDGKGLLGSLLYDSTLILKIDKTLSNVQNVSDSIIQLTGDISSITEKVKSGNGAAGKILMDQQFSDDLTETMESIKKASIALEEDLQALKHNFLFRKYFKKKARQGKKDSLR